MEDAEKRIQELEEQLRKLNEQFGIVNPHLKKFGEAAKKSSAEFKKSIEDLNKEVKKSRAGYADQLKIVSELTDAIEELTDVGEDGAKKQKLLHQRQKLLQEAAWQNTKEQLESFGKDLGKTATKGSADLIRGIQNNASATELSGTILTAGIDLLSSASTSTANALIGVGDAIPVFGGLISGPAHIAKASIEIAASVAKFALEVFGKELDKTSRAFATVSAGGAFFADGMTGMRDAASAAYLTLEDFSAVVQRQSANLSASGLGVPQAVKKMGGALAAGGDGMRKNLMNLGYRIEEHGDLVAETMASMRQSGGPLLASNAQVAEQTQKYAENLRIIAALTGEDGKTRAKAAQEQANQLMFQQKLAALPEEQRAATMRAFMAADEQTRKNFMDLVNFGAVINEQGAIISATIPAQREKQDRMLDLFNKGILDADTYRQLQGETNAALRQQITEQNGAVGGIAAAGAAGVNAFDGLTASVLNMLKEAAPDADAIKTAQGAVKDQKETTDALTGSMNQAEMEAKKLAIALQQVTLDLLPFAAELNKNVLTSAREAAQQAVKRIGEEKTGAIQHKSSWESHLLSKSLGGAAIGGIGGGGIGMFAGPAGAGIGAGIGGTIGLGTGLYQGIKDIMSGEYAEGGIASGPVSGYSAKLHGTEAVVPLPDNRSIPVNLDSSSITAAVHQQSGILSEILRAMQNNNNIASQIAMNTV